MSRIVQGPWRAYVGLFDESWRLLAMTVTLSVAQGLLLLPIAWLVESVFDTQIPHHHAVAVAVTGGVILVLTVTSTTLGLLTRSVSLRVNKRAVARLRMMLTERLYAMSRAELDRSSAGELQSIVVQDSERVDQMSNAVIALVLPAVVISLGLTVAAIVLSPLLCASLLVVMPIMIGANRRLGHRVRHRTRLWQRAFDRFASATGLGLRAMSLTKVHGAEAIEIEHRMQLVGELSETGRQMATTMGTYTILQQSISASAGVVVLIVGGWSAARGDMTIGELLGFYAIAVLLLRQVSTILTNVPVVLAGYESVIRLNALLESGTGEPYTGTREIDFDGSLAFEGVSFAYDHEPVLSDIDLDIAAGEQVAILGPNGAGKSTLVSLLLGLYRPTTGRVLADGIPLDELDMPSLRRGMGVVLQDIAYGRPEATEEEIRRAAELATAAEFIEALPRAYATPVGDEGGLLSSGQRQRVAVARALLAGPALLVLDEPTTHLDDAAIGRLTENLGALPGGPTVIAVSHDPEIEAWAGRTIQLRDGRIAAEMIVAAERR
jgi:ABC-type bacteriocin/lantibiotic exporter with double-glycine peptidase domain